MVATLDSALNTWAEAVPKQRVLPRFSIGTAWNIDCLYVYSALGFRDSGKEPGGDNPNRIPLDPILRDTTPHPSDVCPEGTSGPGVICIICDYL